MVQICLSCKEANKKLSKATKFGKIFNNRKKVSAKWADKYGFINNTPPRGYVCLKNKKRFNQKTGNEISIKLGKKFANRYIYVWAALPISDSLIIKNPKNAYFSNRNVNDVFGRLDKDGSIKIKIRNPQIYKEEEHFPPHIHYKVADKEGTDYTIDFFTMTYLRKINYDNLMDMLKQRNYVILNSLPDKYFMKYYIPGSNNLYYKKCAKMNVGEVYKFIEEILINYPKIYKQVKSKKLNINNIPIIVYCANAKCKAAKELADSLLRKSFVNILYYPGGLNEFYKKTYNMKLF